MVTENEAKKQWCPMERHKVTEACATNINANCKGSGCMMWRWIDKLTKTVSARAEAPDKEPIDHQWIETPNTNRRGFCGLAGKPVV